MKRNIDQKEIMRVIHQIELAISRMSPLPTVIGFYCAIATIFRGMKDELIKEGIPNKTLLEIDKIINKDFK